MWVHLHGGKPHSHWGPFEYHKKKKSIQNNELAVIIITISKIISVRNYQLLGNPYVAFEYWEKIVNLSFPLLHTFSFPRLVGKRASHSLRLRLHHWVLCDWRWTLWQNDYTQRVLSWSINRQSKFNVRLPMAVNSPELFE